jgi:hypothetical protein
VVGVRLRVMVGSRRYGSRNFASFVDRAERGFAAQSVRWYGWAQAFGRDGTVYGEERRSGGDQLRCVAPRNGVENLEDCPAFYDAS